MLLSERITRFGTVCGIVAILGLASCGDEGAGEKAGKKLDKAGQELGKAVDDMKKDLKK